MFDDVFVQRLAETLAPKVAALLADQLSNKIAPRYLNLEQASVYLSTTKDGVRQMLRSKRFPCRKIGSRVLVDVRDIDRVMAEHTDWLT